MKVCEKRIIPEYISRYVKLRKCDLCGLESKGEEWEAKSIYEVAETEIAIEIRQKEGANYPEGGHGTKYEIDLCPNCFKDRLIPWLKLEGANIEEENWNW